ncbi:hypothetical protein DFJ58DRAFT_720921 [Suillus subalutaceus]|uniref:uncharacterized protein n=1 Tax=Suillus subalutaceus TaxID=48586 RepID=UPI001B861532|nr:uncharacterized protein DFJ58DRAFT_720921 [Suillus subalutaceus]KAG1876457.1 hypothetical protein DFJ58DRAFT_720921 [Suillus subalutaceus]
MFFKKKPSSAEKILRRVPTPYTPYTSPISKSTTQISGLNASRITDLSTNPTDDLSHPSAISLTTQRSSRSKHSSTMRKKNKKRRSQKPLANLNSSNPKEPWLDLSFLNRQCTQEDYLCNYWRYMVADEQSIHLDHFLNVIDAHECELWQGFSDDYVPSWAKFLEVRQGWEGNDERKWQAGGWIRGNSGIEWRPGHVMLRVPNNDWIGGSHEDLDDCSNASSRKWMDDEVFVPTEDHEDYGASGELSPAQGRQLCREQDSKPRQEVERTVEPSLIVPHVTSASFILDIPPAHTITPNDVRIVPPAPSSHTPPDHPPPQSKHDSHTSKVSRVSYAPLATPHRTRQFSHRPRRVFTPAPTPVPSEHADDEVTQNHGEIEKLLGFLKMNAEQKVAEIHRLVGSMSRGLGTQS